MKLTAERAPILAALTRAVRAVERRNTIPILSHLLLSAQAGTLAITATDLDVEVYDTVRAEVAAEGKTTVPAHTLLDIVKKLPEGAQITLETDAERGALALRAGRSRFRLQTLSPDDFPSLAPVEGGQAFEVTGHVLAEAIARVSFAISTEETRYYLNGIYLHRHGDKLRLVATDGHRLSLTTLTVEGLPDLPGVIIPRKAVAEIARMAGDADKAPLRLEVSPAKITASLGEARFTSKLIDGTFPDYGRVIPLGNDKVATLKAEDLLAAVGRVATLAGERGSAVKFTLSADGLALEVTNPDAGKAQEEIEATYAAAEIETGFNARYVAEALTATAKAGEIELALADPASPAILRHPGATEDLVVLMPMRIL